MFFRAWSVLMQGKQCCRRSWTEATLKKSKTIPWLCLSAGTVVSRVDYICGAQLVAGFERFCWNLVNAVMSLFPQSLQRHCGATDEASVVCQLRRDGQTGCWRCPKWRTENHSGPPPQDVVQLDGQHQVPDYYFLHPLTHVWGQYFPLL